MKILIVGLGLIGGAYAYRLSNKGYEVYGCDVNIEAINYAKDNKFIVEGDIDPRIYIPNMDVIILGIYPQTILEFLNKNNDLFNENQLITDVCGVKTSFAKEAYLISKPAVYVSHHPMAGREKIGILYSKECVFEGANFLITPINDNHSDKVDILKQLGNDLGFSRISVMNINKHDRMIGFTSQLTHAIAVSLVNSDSDIDTKLYIGDSYRDLTRIAMINENLWSELFLENRLYLLEHIEAFEQELSTLKMALLRNDKETLVELFRSSTKIRKEMEK